MYYGNDYAIILHSNTLILRHHSINYYSQKAKKWKNKI